MPKKTGESVLPPRMVAVIDIGASSLRMQVAEIHSDTGAIRKIESFSQAVSIGQDSFDDGKINRATIEDCVHVLSIYRQRLDEYRIFDPEQIRVVATSGVREASNRMVFIDRVYIATGFEIEPFDEAELHRVTYLGILPFVEKQSKYFSSTSLVLEVGGGTSELLLLEQADVMFSNTYRLGSLRLRHVMDQFNGPADKALELIKSHIEQTIVDFQFSTKHAKPRHLIAMGSDVRFAASELNQAPVGEELVEIKINALEKLVNKILQQSPDQLAAKYHVSLPDAKTLGPGLLTQLMFAKHLQVKKLLVANSNLRDAMIQEMAQERSWTDSIQNQIVRSAVQLGRKFKFNEEHATHVGRTACWIFDEIQFLHRLPVRYRRILELASLLHEIGNFISDKSKHKHSMYLIRNSDIFGIGSQYQNLIAMVARYYRGAPPSMRHDGYAQLERHDRVAVAKLASMLRVAKAIDAGHHQRINKLNCELRGNRLELTTTDVADLTLEQVELRNAAELFEELFGTELSLETTVN
ncbi:MAG: exopolyphosphatase [Planctomycetota bacterium]